MRIAYFTDTYYPEINGVANTLSRLHQYLDCQGIEHIFFAPEYADEEQEGLRIARETGIPVVMSYHTNIEQYLEYFNAKFLEKPVRAYIKHFHSYARLNLCPSMQTYRQLEAQGYRNLDVWTRQTVRKLNLIELFIL